MQRQSNSEAFTFTENIFSSITLGKRDNKFFLNLTFNRQLTAQKQQELLEKWGKLSFVGAQAVKLALEKFHTDQIEPSIVEIPAATLEKIKKFKNECEAYLTPKLEQRLTFQTSKAIFIEDFSLAPAATLKIQTGVHPIQVLAKNENPDQLYLFKKNPGRIAEFEAFNACCYKILLNDRHPSASLVLNKKGEQLGVMVEKLENYEPVANYGCAGRKTITMEEAIECRLADVLVAARLEEEIDLHEYNYGTALVNGKKQFVKIDDDASTFPLISSIDEKKPVDNAVFKPCHEDIKDFPFLSFPLNNWITNNQSNHFEFSFISLKTNEDFIKQKFNMLLKRILIPDSVYIAISQVSITPPYNRECTTQDDTTIPSTKKNESKKTKRERFAEHKIAKTKEWQAVLINMPAFHDHIKNNPTALDDIIQAFEEYNRQEEDKALHIDITKVQEEYEKIREGMAATINPINTYLTTQSYQPYATPDVPCWKQWCCLFGGYDALLAENIDIKNKHDFTHPQNKLAMPQ